MHAIKRKPGMCITGPLPGEHIMTYGAIGLKLSQHMIGFISVLIILPVTIDTIADLAVKSFSLVALVTIKYFVGPFQEISTG